MMLSAEVRQALSIISISPLQCTSLTFESRILGLSACTHSEAVHNCLNKDNDRVLSFSPQSPSETELNIADMICHGKPKSDQFLLPLIETKPLSLQEPLINTYKQIIYIKHLSAVQERSLDSMTIEESATLKSLHHLTIRPHPRTAPSNSPPLHVSKNSDHNSTSGGMNGDSNNKGSTGRDDSSSGREDRGERRDKGADEDSCDKSGGGGGGSYGDGGGSDGEGKKPNRKDQRKHRPQPKKKRKKRGQKKRRRSTKQTSTSPSKKMKKKKQKPSHVHKKTCHGPRLSLEYFTDIAIRCDKTVLHFLPTEESETMVLKPPHFPTTTIKPPPRKSPSKPSMPLYGRYNMYSKRNRRIRLLGDSVHTPNNADDSNDIGKYGDEIDSDGKEEKLSSKIRKRRHPRHKRRKKRRGRREKGKKRRTNSKRRLPKKNKLQNCYRSNIKQGLQPSVNHLFIPNSRLNSQCISVADRRCPTRQLHCGAAEDTNQHIHDAVYDDLEDYLSAPYFPPAIMEQNVVVCVRLYLIHIVYYYICQ